MGQLVALALNDRYKADALLFRISELEKDLLVDLEDAALMAKNELGEIDLKKRFDSYTQFPVSGALYFGFVFGVTGWILTSGEWTGALIGVDAGLLFGWVSGVLTSIYSGIGISGRLMRKTAAAIAPGTAAVILCSRSDITSEKVLDVFKDFEAQILDCSLAPKDVAKLQAVLA